MQNKTQGGEGGDPPTPPFSFFWEGVTLPPMGRAGGEIPLPGVGGGSFGVEI